MARRLRKSVAQGAMPPLVLVVDDCRAAYDRMRAHGAAFSQEHVARYVRAEAGFPDSQTPYYEKLIKKSIFCHFAPFQYDVLIERQI